MATHDPRVYVFEREKKRENERGCGRNRVTQRQTDGEVERENGE